MLESAPASKRGGFGQESTGFLPRPGICIPSSPTTLNTSEGGTRVRSWVILTKFVPGVLVLVLLSTAFSGCVELLGEPGDEMGASSIAKKVVWTLDEDAFEDSDASFEDIVKTRLEYTHKGASVPSESLTFRYLNAKGEPREHPATQFTAAPQIREGDVIAITGVNITSGLVVARGSDVLAKRGNLEDHWFRADNAPLPFYSTKAGAANFEVDSSGGFRFNATGITAEDMMVHRAFANVQGRVTGPLSITTLQPAAGPRIEISADLAADLEMLLEARITEDGNTYEAGMELRDFVGELDGLGTLQFNPSGRLTHTGDSGRVFVDGQIYMWDDNHSRASNYQPEDMDHPWINVNEAYAEEPVESEEPMEAWLVDFLTKLWSMEVAVGDDYRFHFEYDSMDAEVEFDYIIQIVQEEAREVGGKSMPAYRVSQLANLVVDFPNGIDATFDVVRGTYWVSKDSYLPLYAQISSSRSFNRADAETFLNALDEDVPYELPETFVLVLSGEQILKLTSYSGDFTIAPIVGILLGNAGSYGMFGAPSMFVLGSDLGMEEEHAYAMPVAPMLGWHNDELADRLTVVQASNDGDWSDIAVRLTSFPQGPVYVTPMIGGMQREPILVEFYGSEPLTWERTPILAGDYLTFCVDGVVATDVDLEILFEPSYVPLFATRFASLGPCA